MIFLFSVSFTEDKYVRMHLKGRPVPLYAPTNIEDEGRYDVKAAQNPPSQELKLEWVYPSVLIWKFQTYLSKKNVKVLS